MDIYTLSEDMYSQLNGMTNLHPEVVEYIQEYGLGLFQGAWNLNKLLKTTPTPTPEFVGKPVVSIGGGWASTYELVKWTLDNKLDVNYVYCPIGNDDKQLIQAVENKFGIIVHRVGPHGGIMPHSFDGFDIWHVFFAVKYLGNWRNDPCSRVLKREAMAKFIKLHNIDKIYLGITQSEIDRMIAITGNYQRQGVAALAPLGDLPEPDKITKSQLIFGYTPESYLQSLPHNNCDGWCIKAGIGHIKRWLWYHPVKADYYALLERIWNLYFRSETYRTVYRLQRVIDGKNTSIPIPMSELYAMYRAEWAGRLIPPYAEFDEGLSSCQVCSY